MDRIFLDSHPDPVKARVQIISTLTTARDKVGLDLISRFIIADNAEGIRQMAAEHDITAQQLTEAKMRSGHSFLYTATKRKAYKAIGALIANGAERANGEDLISLAADSTDPRNAKVIELYLDQGFGDAASIDKALQMALYHRQPAFARPLLRHAADANGTVPRHHVPLVKGFRHDGSPITEDFDGSISFLSYSLDRQDLKSMRLLIDNGAKPFEEDEFGYSPFDYSIGNGAELGIKADSKAAALFVKNITPENALKAAESLKDARQVVGRWQGTKVETTRDMKAVNKLHDEAKANARKIAVVDRLLRHVNRATVTVSIAA